MASRLHASTKITEREGARVHAADARYLRADRERQHASTDAHAYYLALRRAGRTHDDALRVALTRCATYDVSRDRMLSR